MRDTEAEEVVDKALDITGLPPEKRPKILTDNGPSYISNDLKDFL